MQVVVQTAPCRWSDIVAAARMTRGYRCAAYSGAGGRAIGDTPSPPCQVAGCGAAPPGPPR